MSKKLELWQIFGERSIVDMQPVGGTVFSGLAVLSLKAFRLSTPQPNQCTKFSNIMLLKYILTNKSTHIMLFLHTSGVRRVLTRIESEALGILQFTINQFKNVYGNYNR